MRTTTLHYLYLHCAPCYGCLKHVNPLFTRQHTVCQKVHACYAGVDRAWGKWQIMLLNYSPLTYQAHDLLVLDLLVLVHALPRERRVLLRVTCAQCIDRGQDGALQILHN